MNQYKTIFLQKHPLPAHHLRTLQAIQDCRTPALGGHVHACTGCGHVHFSFHSCRNRHCPRCQHLAREKWVQQRLEDLLPIPYFHVVFTMPHQLNELCMHHPCQMYDLLFKSAWETINTLGNDPKWLGAQTGMTAVLHTWGQGLSLHPHVHCLVPGGGLDKNGKWRKLPYAGKYLFPGKVMQKIYRGKMMEGLAQLILRSPSKGKEEKWKTLKNQLYKTDWVVYAKQPFAGPSQVIKYLGKYTHRIAISNQRLIKVEKGKVIFHYKDYRDNKQKTMPLEVTEFLRRFCLHILPSGFRRMRHYGLLSNASKKKSLQKAREQLGIQAPQKIDFKTMDWKELFQLVKGVDVDKCRHCEHGRLVKIGAIPSQRPPPGEGFVWHPIDVVEK